MPGISLQALLEVCGPVFGLELEPERFITVINELEAVLGEIAKLRELDLHDLDPAVIFDPETGYRDQHHG